MAFLEGLSGGQKLALLGIGAIGVYFLFFRNNTASSLTGTSATTSAAPQTPGVVPVASSTNNPVTAQQNPSQAQTAPSVIVIPYAVPVQDHTGSTTTSAGATVGTGPSVTQPSTPVAPLPSHTTTVSHVQTAPVSTVPTSPMSTPTVQVRSTRTQIQATQGVPGGQNILLPAPAASHVSSVATAPVYPAHAMLTSGAGFANSGPYVPAVSVSHAPAAAKTTPTVQHQHAPQAKPPKQQTYKSGSLARITIGA